MQSPHIEADHHLPLRPGTNVAVVNALAHVIVTEGLVDEAFVRERCDWDEFQGWAEFIADPRHSPEAMEALTGVARRRCAARRGSTRPAATRAIYYGLGVTEHSQGSTTVMGIANLAMLTGNIGREGVGVNPLRGQNNVQGSCDMGSFPHELSGYRHVKNADVRAVFEEMWGGRARRRAGAPHPQHARRRRRGHASAGSTARARTSCSPTPTPGTSRPGSRRWTASIVQDLFLNETANYAHVFLPGSTFLEKDGTFTNAERRINRVREVIKPRNGYADWEVTQLLANAMGARWTYTHPAQIMAEVAATTPTFAGVTYELLDEQGSVQWPCNARNPLGTPTMHVDGFVRGKGRFIVTEYVATDEKTGPRFPLLLTTGRILSQYNVGAQTRRTANVVWHDEDLLEIHPHDAEVRGIADGGWVKLASRAGETSLAGSDHRPGGAGRGLHDVPPPGHPGQRHHLRLLGLGDQLPRVQGHGGAGVAVERTDRVAAGVRGAGGALPPRPGGGVGRTPRPRRLRAAGAPSHRTLEIRPVSSPDKLVYMANQIATFFESQRRENQVERVALHLRDFWDPAMRSELLRIVDSGGSRLKPIVLDAAERLRDA